MRYLFFLTVLVFHINFCKGQHEYIPLVKEKSYCIKFGFLKTDTYPKPSDAKLFYFAGDSIYNAKLYGKRYFSNLSGIHPCPPEQRPCFLVDKPYKPIDSNYEGLYRDDTDQNKVFYIPKDNMAELEVYNFTLTVGDTISNYLKSIMPEEYEGEGIIDSTSYDFISEKERKVLYLKAKSHYWPFNTYFIEVIEGIGLKCDYCEGTLEQCNISSSSKDIEKLRNLPLKLDPNPVSEILTIESDLTIQKLTIIDYNGRIVLSSTEKEINVSQLLSGVYFLKCLSGDNKMYFSKFVKI